MPFSKDFFYCNISICYAVFLNINVTDTHVLVYYIIVVNYTVQSISVTRYKK